jgi:hypothetical protein
MEENPFAKLLQSRRDRGFPVSRYEVDLNDPTPFDKQIFDQVRSQGVDRDRWGDLGMLPSYSCKGKYTPMHPCLMP